MDDIISATRHKNAPRALPAAPLHEEGIGANPARVGRERLARRSAQRWGAAIGTALRERRFLPGPNGEEGRS